MSDYLLSQGTRGPTDQRERARDDQTENSEGGFVWGVDCWTRLRRFLILGSEGGSYYATEKALTTENVAALRECVKADGPRAVNEIVEISDSGRAPKNDPALYALAYCISHGDLATRQAAAEALPLVARIGTHLYHFVAYAQTMRGWGKILRRAVAGWYEKRPLDSLAYDVVKYRQRDGWSHRDLLRKSHPDFDEEQRSVATFLTGNEARVGLSSTPPKIVEGFLKAQASGTPEETAELVREYGLPREALLTEHLPDIRVWQALLDAKMPIGAMTRNLGNMTRLGVFEDTDYRALIVSTLTDAEVITKSRLHPFSILLALSTYRNGEGFRGGNVWTPIDAISDALNDAFYLAFKNVRPTHKKLLVALDVSGSMGSPLMNGPLTVAEGAAALAMIHGVTEANVECVTFSNGSSSWYGKDAKAKRTRFYGLADGLEPFSISKRRRLDDVYREAYARTMGGTDCALPMVYATETDRDYDAFVVYTDNETWSGGIQPFEALKRYREKSGNDQARLAVVGMVSNGFTIADPNDPGMLDVVGFDTAAPNLIGEFIAGRL